MYLKQITSFLTCQRLIFRLIGVPLGKSETSQRNRNAPDVVTRRYGNGNMAEHTTWPPELASHVTMTTPIWRYKHSCKHLQNKKIN
jgi:hypothetical protein